MINWNFAGANIQANPEAAVQGCSENIQQIYWRTPMPKCDFTKVALQLY